MKEAAVTLPGALGFYLSVVWKPLRPYSSRTFYIAASCVDVKCMRLCARETFTFAEISHNEKPVVTAGRCRAYTLCTPALSHLDLFTHIQDAPRPNDAPVFPSGVFTPNLGPVTNKPRGHD